MIQCQRDNGPVTINATLDEVLDYFQAGTDHDMQSHQSLNFYTLLTTTYNDGNWGMLTHLSRFAHHYTLCWHSHGYQPLSDIVVIIMPSKMVVSTMAPNSKNISSSFMTDNFTKVSDAIKKFCV